MMISRRGRSASTTKIFATQAARDVLALSCAIGAMLLWWVVFRPADIGPGIFILAAVTVSVWCGGARSGVLSATAGILGDIHWYVLPKLTPSLTVPQVARLLVLTIFAAAIITAVTRLRRTQRMLHAIIAASPLPIFTTDTASRVTTWNPAAEHLLGWSAEEVIGRPLPAVPSDGQREYRGLLARSLEGESLSGIEVRRRTKDGRGVDLSLATAPLIGENGRVTGTLAMYTDITERNRVELALREERERIRSSFEDSMIGIALSRVDGTLLDANPALCHLLGYSRDDLLLTSFPNLTYPEDTAETMEQQPRIVSGELSSITVEKRYVHKDGHAIWCLVHASLVRDDAGQPLHFITEIQDITSRKEHHDHLQHQALHDALTMLPNRVLLHDRLDQATRLGERRPSPFALLLLDVDRFKRVNDTLGHDIGDRLLQEVASRLSGSVRKSDTVARLGGDEFAIILPGTDAENARRIARTIGASVRLPLTIDERQITVGTSIGIALYPAHGEDSGTLLRHADLAMYAAKRANVGETLYRPDQERCHPGHRDIADDLRIAIEQDELLLAYEPTVDMETGYADHVEALLRWNHPDYGMISPNEFIPLAEERGLIDPLSRWVLKTALQQCREWQRAELNIRVAVNLSAQSLQDVYLPDTVGWFLRQAGVTASSLMLEITEGALMDDPVQALLVLQRLHAMGVRIAVDDFGTGYPSLPYMEQLPLDVIKIDGSFVSAMTSDRKVIVRSVIDLARNLGAQVTAEGTETQDASDLLREMGCTMAQGSLVSPPLPAAEMTAWLQARAGTVAHGS